MQLEFNFEENRKITKPIRLIELFGGVGAQAMALKEIGANFEHYRLVEFDKYPVASYNAIHKTNFQTLDIRNVKGEDLGIVDTDKFEYLMTYSFPCQDLSVAGKGQGMTKGSGTRSGLLWEVERLLNETKNLPQVLLMENVPQVHGKKNKADFDAWCEFLHSKGYVNYWQDLNAKDYGVAQSRNRTFMVSFLGGGGFEFPPKKPLTKTMADYLEKKVDEKFYVKSEKAQELILNLKERKLLDLPEEKTSEIQILGKMDHTKDHTLESANRVYKTSGLCPTVSTCQGGDRQPKICEKNIIIDDTQGFENEPRVYEGLAPSLRSQRAGLKTIEQTICASEKKENGKFLPCKDYKITPKEICPAICAHISKDMAAQGTSSVLEKIIIGGEQKNQAIKKDGVCTTLTSSMGTGGGYIPMIVAMRGRNPDEPSDRTPGATTKQRLEPNSEGICNTLTSVQKDNLLLEAKPECLNLYKDEGKKTAILPVVKGIERVGQISSEGSQCGTVVNPSGLFPTVSAGVHGYGNPHIVEKYRIRKLTPRECWRLMAFSDVDFEAAAAVNSNTQLYKQAGNSIVKDVLVAIFKQML